MFQIRSWLRCDVFRDEVRRWLEAELPAARCARRRPMATTACGAARSLRRRSGRARLARAHGRARLDRPDLAARVRRRRALGGRGGGAARGDARLGCRAPLKSLGVWMLGPVLLRVGDGGAEARAPAARWSAARCAGARATASRRRAPTSPASARARCSTATRTSSTGGRSGRRTRTWPTGCSASCGRTRTRPSTRGSASSSST